MAGDPLGEPSRTGAGRLAGVTVVAVFAHPDDEALACGGTLARAADAGARVVLVCASRGELGSVADPVLVPDGDLGRVRDLELRDSARTLGVAEVHQLGHPDGSLRWVDGLDDEIAGVLRRHRPAIVITFDADGLYWHGDHIGVHEATSRAVDSLGGEAPALYFTTLAAGAIRALAEAAHARGGAPPESSLWGLPPDAFGAATPAPDFRVDVREWADRKLAAIRCHGTQVGAGSPFAWIDARDVRRWLGYERFRRAPGAAAGPAGLEWLREGAA